MSEIIDRRISFNAGEMSPWLDPRIDLDKYQMGCRQMENMRGSIYGGAIKRAGTQYIGAALTAATAVRLIPWLGGDGTDYVLEFTDLKLRVWDAFTLELLESAPDVPLEIVTVFTAAQLEEIQYGQQNDVMYFTHPSHTPQVLVNAAEGWQLGQARFDRPATLGPNTSRIRIVPLLNVYVDTWSSAVAYLAGNHVLSGGVVYRCILASTNHVPPNATYWRVTTWSNGKVYQAADVLLYSGSYYQVIAAHTAATGAEPGTTAGEARYVKGTRKDEPGIGSTTPNAYVSSTKYVTGQLVIYLGSIYVRTSYQSGQISGYAPDSARGEDYWDTVSSPPVSNAADEPVGQGETITLEATAGLFDAGHLGTTWVIAHQRENPKTTLKLFPMPAAGTVSDPVYVLGAFSISLTQRVTDPGIDLELVIEQSTDLAIWETYTGISANSSNAQQIIAGSFEEPIYLRIKVLKIAGINDEYTVEITPDSATQYGLATITAVNSSTSAVATLTQPLYRPWATSRWEEPAFSAFRGFPRAVTLHLGRLWFGGTEYRPTSVWGSTVDAYWDFRLGAADDRALSYTLATDESSRVEWMVSQDMLVIGTSSSEWVIGQRPGDDEVRLRRNTSFGSAAVQARAVSDSVVFIQKSRRKLREFAWSFERDGYLANDLSMLAEHLGDAGMRQIGIQRNPEAVVWIITTRGDLLALTYERAQNVAGWARMTTAGTFESIAILPGDGEEDIIWLCVVREIDGSTVRYIERVAPDQLRALKDGEVSDLTFSDCAITVEPEGSATGDVVVSGLTVDVPTLAYDGDVLTRPSYSADSGNYTLAAELPKASATLGAGQAAIFFEAVTGGTGGNSITVEILAHDPDAETSITADITDITVTPGANREVLIVSGFSNPTTLNGDYYKISENLWKKDRTGIENYPQIRLSPFDFNVGYSWYIEDESGSFISAVIGYSLGKQPDDDSLVWTNLNATGSAVVDASIPTAQQIITAINADAGASALVTASNAPGSDGSGAMPAVAATPLTGGSDTPRWRLTAAGTVLLAASTETYPWNILPAAWNGGPPTITPAESTIDGLDHLEGEEVVILADGSVHRPLTVASGEITLDYSVTKAVIGLPYTAVIEPTWLETPEVAGFSKAAKKRIHRIITEMWKTAGTEISVDNGVTWKPMETRSTADLMDANRTLITGLREEFVGGSTARQISCILRSKDPLPMLLQSLHIRYQIDAK
jgi:hypothetical protein